MVASCDTSFFSSLKPLLPSPSAHELLIRRIDEYLPQTQCTQCDYPRCKLYAAAIADGTAGINQCPPGGSQTIAALAALTGEKESPLNPANGIEEPKLLAWIEEQDCIGCKLCIKACPVDCIIGGPKLMHTVIANQCTGCKLCVPVCPTDCIALLPAPLPASDDPSRWPAFSQTEVELSRLRTEQKLGRSARRMTARSAEQTRKKRAQLKQGVAAAIARKRAARADSKESQE